MSRARPLLISDCDDVILHMMSLFGPWVDEAHGVVFQPSGHDFAGALRRRADMSPLPPNEIKPLLDDFFRNAMARQTLIPHAAEALERIAEVADVVILTNVREEFRLSRVSHLAELGLHYPVICNQGGKGAPVKRLLAQMAPSAAVFVDDLAFHHASVAQDAPDTWRLHMVGEIQLAGQVPPAPDAHARIDDWREAVPWVLDRFEGKRP